MYKKCCCTHFNIGIFYQQFFRKVQEMLWHYFQHWILLLKFPCTIKYHFTIFNIGLILASYFGKYSECFCNAFNIRIFIALYSTVHEMLWVYANALLLSLAQLDACPTGNQEIVSSWLWFGTIFRWDGSWNLFYGHSLPSADSRREVVSYLQKNMHWVLVNRLGGVSLPRKSLVRLTDRPAMTIAVDCEH